MTMKVTPMMEQYFAAKNEHPDAVLFFRMGDFYEMFYDDAVTVSRELDLTLTSRNKGADDEQPMAGVPHHAVEGYIIKLVEKGYKVAVCDQLEEPSPTKKIVRRGVTRVVTPGVILDADHIEAKRNNYLVAVCASSDKEAYGFGLACVDVSTGEFRATEVSELGQLMTELGRLAPREVLIPEKDAKIFEDLGKHVPGSYTRHVPDRGFDRKEVLRASEVSLKQVEEDNREGSGYFAGLDKIEDFFKTVRGHGFRADRPVERCVAAVLGYIVYTQRGVGVHIHSLECYKVEDFLGLDDATRANLELTETLMGGRRKGSLIGVLDETVTAMGGRRLRSWLSHPLVDLKRIQRRHEAVGELKDDLAKRQDVRQRLKATYDIERLIGRVSSGNANGRDMVSLRATLEMIPGLKAALEGSKCELLRIIQKRLDPCQDLCELLSRALVDEPPTGVKEGDIFREGYHPELDELISLGRDGKDWLLEYETKERARTGIQSLKVKFTSVFGYFIEITKANFHLIPADYIRKQTLANAERFFTEDLKEYEEKVLTAQDRRVALEYKLFEDLREQVAAQLSRLHQSAYLLSTLDVLGGLAEIAARHGYCRPEMTEDDTLDILDGRHPVVEQSLPSDERFVANSVRLDCADSQLLLITGPNMAGKSTIIRQVALISLLAQMGSFVPASSARLSIVDRIFSRVGASDNLAKGQSTFMVEMTETAHILKSATRRSLIILDEIGRGTSTYDGLSIAWAVAEFIHDEIGAKTLFATHYHELTILAEQLRGVQNFNIACKEWKDDVIFLRKLVPGPANRSYGIQVGRLAGLPAPVVERAKELLANLERTSHGFIEQPSHGSAAVEVAGKPKANAPAPALSPKLVAALSGQLPSLPVVPAMAPEVEQVLGEVKKMELSTLTPLEALNLVYKLQKRLLA